jgi:predicted unusual protein kinase regulating ubiquinone biosynthesis (AarF/ABC1/UbiB family)
MRKLGFEHRDLHKGNVLVRSVDGELFPCLIDFGQSKIGTLEGEEFRDGNDDENFVKLCAEFNWP